MRLLDVGGETFQRLTVLFQESEIILRLRFYPTVALWCFDAEYKDFAIYGTTLAVGTPHMVSSNQAFDFVVSDNSGNGLDPFKADDFASGRCSLYMLEPADMEALRGLAVEI